MIAEIKADAEQQIRMHFKTHFYQFLIKLIQKHIFGMNKVANSDTSILVKQQVAKISKKMEEREKYSDLLSYYFLADSNGLIDVPQSQRLHH